VTRRLALAVAAALTVAPAQAGPALMLCTPFGCVRGPAPQLRLWRGEAPPAGYRGPPIGSRPPPAISPPPERASAPAGPPRATPEQAQIENEILAFCQQHPDEGFCGKLAAYLAKQGRAPTPR
jgi:hypothetical protein